jgi:hypothetical protein
LFCKRAGCRARFLNFNNLFDHQKEHQVQDERNKFELLQINLNLQFRQPLRKGNTSTLKLFKECHQHRFLLPSDCAMCAEVEHFVQPQKPCQWYRSVHYFIPTTQEPHFIDINGGQHLVPMVRTVRSSGGSGDTCSGGRIGLYPVVVQGLAIDHVGQAWIVGRMWPAEITCNNQKEQESVQFQHNTRASSLSQSWLGTLEVPHHKEDHEDHEDHEDQHQHPHVPHCHSID